MIKVQPTRRVIGVGLRLAWELDAINGIVLAYLHDVIVVTVFFEEAIAEDLRNEQKAFVNIHNLERR